MNINDGYRLDQAGSHYVSVADTCEHIILPEVSIKVKEFTD